MFENVAKDSIFVLEEFILQYLNQYMLFVGGGGGGGGFFAIQVMLSKLIFNSSREILFLHDIFSVAAPIVVKQSLIDDLHWICSDE